jgi:RNA polymerase sigma factor (sigma-70 family)
LGVLTYVTNVEQRLTVDADADPVLSADEVALILHQRRRSLEGLAVSLLRNATTAQDAVQDAIESVLRVARRFECERVLLAYTKSAVVNRCRSLLRREGVARRYLGRLGRDPDCPPADEGLLLAEEHRQILGLFYRLPTKQRETLALRHFSRLNDAEIAEVLDVSVATVRSNVSRGLARLTQLLQEVS